MPPARRRGARSASRVGRAPGSSSSSCAERGELLLRGRCRDPRLSSTRAERVEERACRSAWPTPSSGPPSSARCRAPGTLTTRSRSTSLARVDHHAQVRERVLHLGALVELRAADDLVGHVRRAQRLLEHARLRVDAVEDRDLPQVDVPRPAPAGCASTTNAASSRSSRAGDDADRLAVLVVGPQLLRLALARARDDAQRAPRRCARSSGSSARASRPSRPGSRARKPRMLRTSAPRQR